MRLLLLLASLIQAEPIPPCPTGSGQITEPIEWLADPQGKDTQRQFASQATPNGKLVLTASNGFFDPGIRARGTAKIKDAADASIIAPDFAYLDHWSIPDTTTRWHLWIENPGILYANTYLTVSPANAGSKLSYSLAGTSHELITQAQSDPAKPQGAPLAFPIPNAGWHTLTIQLKSLAGSEVGQLHQLELFGPAATASRLLRTRWRPAACHARFSSSSVKAPQLWVMSTRSSPSAAVSSYSPITTPFGYFGSSFNPDGTSGGSANFSLWSYPRGKPTTQDRWSHMLAVGSPLATFGSFGHEGSGVKLRGDWKPFGDQSKEVTLALRAESAPPWIRWFGYYLDPETKRFRLFAAAAKWNGSKPMRSLNPGAFVEQPGPPDRRRCGDLVRDIHRHGWMLDAEKNWHPVDTMSSGKAGVIAAKHWRSTPDDWFSMGMGGIPHYPGPGEPTRLDLDQKPLPDWLQGSALEDLYQLPATIGKRQISNITKSSATLAIPLSELRLEPGESATLTVCHGPEDCLTFDQDLGYRETKTKWWPQRNGPTPATEGDNIIQLTDLAPGTTQYLRILVESPRGRIWSFETDHFTTLPP